MEKLPITSGTTRRKAMVEGRIEKEIPWSVLHQIADGLEGKLVHITCVDHTGRDYKRIVIEYEEKK